MSVDNKVFTLKSEIIKSLSVQTKIYNYYRDYINNTFKPEENRIDQAIVISDLICNYYTCLETIFLRISQFFENNLQNEKWHQDLLKKMNLDIRNVRKAVISDETYLLLLELLKFRHFKRYYYDLDYDRDRLEYIRKKFEQAETNIHKELENFIIFLDKI